MPHLGLYHVIKSTASMTHCVDECLQMGFQTSTTAEEQGVILRQDLQRTAELAIIVATARRRMVMAAEWSWPFFVVLIDRGTHSVWF